MLEEEPAPVSVCQNSQLPTKKSPGSFSQCPARYGGRRDHDAVEEFLTAVETYKDIECIGDEEALKGISLLMHGIAATWWQGVRREATTWTDVVRMIREHFAPPRPPYQIYMEIFRNRQDDSTDIDTFICQKRALLAQLPSDRHDVDTELDLVYGLVGLRYRRHVLRHQLSTFNDLLQKCRQIEQICKEERANPSQAEYHQGSMAGGFGSKSIKRCNYCNFRGHTQNECRKRKQKETGATASASDQPNNDDEKPCTSVSM